MMLALSLVMHLTRVLEESLPHHIAKVLKCWHSTHLQVKHRTIDHLQRGVER